jgi:hypothetical protein
VLRREEPAKTRKVGHARSCRRLLRLRNADEADRWSWQWRGRGASSRGAPRPVTVRFDTHFLIWLVLGSRRLARFPGSNGLSCYRRGRVEGVYVNPCLGG